MAEPTNASTPGPARRGAVAVLALTALVLAWCAALAGLLWMDLADAEREAWQRLLQPRRGLVFLFVLALPLVLWLAVRTWIQAWPRAARRLSEAVSVVVSANAGHRVEPTGPHEMRALALAIDRLAQAHAALRRDVDGQVQQAQAELAAETRRLAALMAELAMGVVVCNRDGRVLLYNGRASSLLGGEGELGLGRAAGMLLDAGALDHAWQQVLRRHASASSRAPVQFATALRTGPGAGTLLRVQMVPTLDDAGAPGGYVLLLDDITQATRADARREALVRGLTEGLRSALGNLRAAAQALHRYPAMEAGRRAGLSAVVHEEAERLARVLREALSDEGATRAAAWPLEDVQAGDLAWALQRDLARGPAPLACRVEGGDAERWLRVDSHAVVQALALLARRLHAELGACELALETAGEPATPRLDLRWQGRPLEPGRLEAWEQGNALVTSPVLAGGLRPWLEQHDAVLWSEAAADAQGRHRLCLQFGRAHRAAGATSEGAPGSEPGALRHRPIAYDFDLFHQVGQNTGLDDTPLSTLRLTVFDTETTGLRPTEGDEIISLGAVRIVNGRLLEHERFDRRVRPRRPVRASAQAVHGISTASLAGEPPLEAVLPAFARFCEDTVLVAHNAAFDLRFLELAQERAAVRFDQPVLDTMLLSAVALPGLGSDEHHLEQIAGRLGVPAAGRHQALGDALITARVLLQLLPLLAARGIVTLGQAREASRRVAQAHEAF